MGFKTFKPLKRSWILCPRGKALRILRHNEIRSTIANGLRATGKIVHEEVPTTAFVNSDRRIDMIMIDPKFPKKGWIFDPTIRWEQTTKMDQKATAEEKKSQAIKVDKEKRVYYTDCIPELKT